MIRKNVKISSIPTNETILFAEQLQTLIPHRAAFDWTKFIITDKAFYCRRCKLITNTLRARIDETQQIHITRSKMGIFKLNKKLRRMTLSTVLGTLCVIVNPEQIEEIKNILLELNPSIEYIDETIATDSSNNK
ncbi:MAG: hypothetical protein IJY05_03230 [Clostridia bacterium]|nr:hypothetical protein [Clostridia bacterium]